MSKLLGFNREKQVMHLRFSTTAATIAAVCALLPVGASAESPHGSFVPGLSIVGNVFQPDGQTLRTYETPTGNTYWSPTLPVHPGDKLVLKVFATTGGGELSKLIVRLDNVKIAEPTAAPWTTTVDTSALQQGSHMIEVWAEEGNDPAKAATKTFAFVVGDNPTQVASTTTEGTAVVEPDMPIGAPAPSSDPTPKFLIGKPVDAAAGVMVRCDDAEVDQELTSDNGSIAASSPILLYCERTPGGTAVAYGYSITRDGRVVVGSSEAESLHYVKIQIQPLADNKTGLLPGKVTLWVWGVDKEGHPSNPVHRDFVIGSASGQ